MQENRTPKKETNPSSRIAGSSAKGTGRKRNSTEEKRAVLHLLPRISPPCATPSGQGAGETDRAAQDSASE
ncbi:hypothetical protein CLOM_g21130 [Closterium sp. NIES-68]|nr:hypothetical protein CLOM_g21130 [Closterium sp. NIES-68]GJP60646.1 hypothetical protein CLOP_g17873 [Closterium sp. NIES-67]GJP69056.1 hypothetical protein CLOP_g25683 [Closterium sp. NIES-67]